RDAYFKKHGVRWFELARLPYFDPVRMSVIDPMHCLLLGIVKTLWFEVWIKTKALRKNTDGGRSRELDFVHRLLDEFEAPSWLGRLPKHVGEPAGGNLSADEWRVMCDGYGPVVVRIVSLLQRARLLNKILLRFQYCALRTRPSRRRKWSAPLQRLSSSRRIEHQSRQVSARVASRRKSRCSSACPRRSSSFSRGRSLRSSASAAHRSSSSIWTVYDGQYLKYNHHWATHIPDEIIDFGPVYGFWTFPGERINKLIKSLNSNNHRDGELEISFLREFLRS
ncbi:hypothetical protein EXIGLDRAFT_575436, partial [Exidia glandulosa HHB12029]